LTKVSSRVKFAAQCVFGKLNKINKKKKTTIKYDWHGFIGFAVKMLQQELAMPQNFED